MTLQRIYENFYEFESTDQIRAASLLSDLRAWGKTNRFNIDQVILDAAEAIGFSLESVRMTPELLSTDEDVIIEDELILVSPAVRRRAEICESILDSYVHDRKEVFTAIVIEVLRSFQQGHADFLDCADQSDQIFDRLRYEYE